MLCKCVRYMHLPCSRASFALDAGSMSGPLSGDSFGSATLSKKASQLAEQLQRGNPMDKITAARRLQKVAAKDSKVGLLSRQDAVLALH